MGEHHIGAAVEAVLHSDRPADETPSGQVPHIHRPSSGGAAHSVPASRGRQTPAMEDDARNVDCTAHQVPVLMGGAHPDANTANISLSSGWKMLVRKQEIQVPH